MQFLDEVRVTVSKEKYEQAGVFKGAVGTIIFSEIRYNQFEVVFSREDGTDYAEMPIEVSDLELHKSRGFTDEEILSDLPNHDPRWWCKVENGYILNLLGEKKNKTPFDYNS